ncbi:MAG: dihydropteroate synthase [Hyphomicrobiales bacterium]|jgi:dihydropteroate synthase|nr:dihydropteroate synthase [Hyphomicrobiales bacterium]
MTNSSVPLPGGRVLRLDARPLVMGVLNVTPDSFSDGGRHDDVARAVAHGLQMAADGADLIDIGGESTRPGYTPVSVEDEIARVEPVVRALAAQVSAPLSIDTMKAKVAARALAAGASIVNDVWGFQRDPDMARVVAEHGAAVVLMHNREREDASLDIVEEVKTFLLRSMDIAQAARISLDRLILDPGIGFGKTPDQNLTLVREIGALAALGCPVLLGVSRKRIIGSVTGRTDPRDRLAGTLALHTLGALQGARIIRAHDVAPHVDAMKMVAAFTAQGRA